MSPVIRDALGNRWRKPRALAKRDAEDAPGQRGRDGAQGELRVPFRRRPDALHQRHCLIERKPLAFAVVRNARQILVHQFDPATVEERPVVRGRHQYRPTAVIRYPDDPVSRHDVSSSASAVELRFRVVKRDAHRGVERPAVAVSRHQADRCPDREYDQQSDRDDAIERLGDAATLGNLAEVQILLVTDDHRYAPFGVKPITFSPASSARIAPSPSNASMSLKTWFSVPVLFQSL